MEFALPQATVAVDSRIELFPPEVWAAIDRLDAMPPDASPTLSEWDVDVVVARPNQSALADELRSAGWRLIARDEDGSVLARAEDARVSTP